MAKTARFQWDPSSNRAPCICQSLGRLMMVDGLVVLWAKECSGSWPSDRPKIVEACPLQISLQALLCTSFWNAKGRIAHCTEHGPISLLLGILIIARKFDHQTYTDYFSLHKSTVNHTEFAVLIFGIRLFTRIIGWTAAEICGTRPAAAAKNAFGEWSSGMGSWLTMMPQGLYSSDFWGKNADYTAGECGRPVHISLLYDGQSAPMVETGGLFAKT